MSAWRVGLFWYLLKEPGHLAGDVCLLGPEETLGPSRVRARAGPRQAERTGAAPERNAVEARLLEKEQPIVKVSTGIGG